MSKDSSRTWAAMSLVSGLAAAALARKVLNGGWKAATGKEPPLNPADPDVELREAVMWAAASGTLVALARMFAGRRAARYYVRSTGHLPPELEADSVRAARQAAAAAEEKVPKKAGRKRRKKG